MTEDVTLWSKFQGKNFYLGNSFEMERSERFKAPSYVETLVLEPREEVGITSFDADEKRVRRAFSNGYKDTIANEKLKEFLFY